ncbi:MAG: hypothetical protein ACM3OC_02530 [Deltaproteobacteria bacterium]
MDRKNILIFAFGGLAVLLLFLFIVTADQSNKNAAAYKQAESDKEALAGQLNPLREQYNTLKEKYNTLNGQIDSLNAEKQKLQTTVDGFTRDKDALMAQIGQLNSNLSQANQALESARSQLKKGLEIVQASPEPTRTPAPGDVSEYWAGVLKQKATLEMKLDDVNREFANIRLSGERLQREKNDVEQELASVTRDRDDLKRELEYNKKMIDGLTLELATEKNNSFEIKRGIKALKDENSMLKYRLRSVSERKEELEGSLGELKAKNAELETSVDKMQVFVKEKIQQVDSFREEFSSPKQEARAEEQKPQQRAAAVNLPPIVIRPEGVPQALKRDIDQQVETIRKSEASILAVNKENNFVILSQGKAQGIKAGDSFTVYDTRNQPAGEVEVIQVRDNIAAADIKKEIEPFKAGFLVGK